MLETAILSRPRSRPLATSHFLGLGWPVFGFGHLLMTMPRHLFERPRLLGAFLALRFHRDIDLASAANPMMKELPCCGLIHFSSTFVGFRAHQSNRASGIRYFAESLTRRCKIDEICLWGSKRAALSRRQERNGTGCGRRGWLYRCRLTWQRLPLCHFCSVR